MARARPPKPRVPPPSAEPADRRRDVLEAALQLMADQGYAGASLRKLAEKVGMRQPSLYHYFRSKEQLVEQIIETFSADMFVLGPRSLPEKLEDVPQIMVDMIFELYEHTPHPLFVRVVFAVSRSHPRYGKLLREIFVDRAEMLMRAMAQPFVLRGEVAEDEVVDLTRMVVNAIGFRLMEEKVLFDERPLGPEVHRFAAFVVETARMRIAQLTEKNMARRTRGR
jgi:AcrR family transcriptional regulator